MANITTQTIRVDLSTGKVIPTAYTHQNDTARTLVFDMYNGGMPYTMTGNTVKFAYKSPIVNGQYSVIAGASMASGTVSGNKVTVTLPSEYTAISGVGMLTMIITPTSGTVRPVNIRLVVQKSADGDDVVMGASDWPDGLYDYMDNWLEENEPTEIANLKSDLLELQNGGYVADAQRIGEVIDDWLDEHPEATTTVQDGAITEVKFADSLKLKAIKDYITPQMFGAKGDGVTDDSDAIQSAIDYLHENNMGILYFPEGTYLRNSTIRSQPNISFLGCSKKSIIKTNAFNIPFVLADDNTVDSLTFDGNHRVLGDEDQTLNTTVYPMGKRIIIQNSYFMDSVGSLVSSAGGEDLVIKNNTFDGYKDHAIYLTTTSSKNILIDGNMIHGNSSGSDAIKFREGVKKIIITNNICDNVIRFVNLSAQENSCDDVLIKGNEVTSVNHAFLAYRTSTAINKNIVIKNNIFECTTYTGAIDLYWNSNCSAKDIIIDGNVFKNYSVFGNTVGDSSVYLENLQFINNVFMTNIDDPATSAIFNFSKGLNIRFEGNTLICPNYHSTIMYIGSNIDISVINNVFKTKTSTLINLNNASNVKFSFIGNFVNYLVQRPIYKGAVTDASLCIISDNIFDGFGQAYIYDLTAVDSSKYMVRDNIVSGKYYNYDVTSYTPSYLGQMAIKGGVAYVATGTASASDWKAFTS